MENTNTKWYATGAGFVMILLMFSFTQHMKSSRNGNIEDYLTVSMPRPVKDLILGFSLEGRTIFREIEGAILGTKSGLVDKKNPASPTKATADKGANKTKIQKQVAAQRARAQLNEQRRRAFQARVIEQAERYRQSLIAAQAPQAVKPYEEPNALAPAPKANGAAKDNDKENEKEKLTAAEWKSLILTQPTEANVQKMIQAQANKEIDLQTYMEIVESLVKDNSQEKRKLGVKALVTVHNQAAFTMAAHLITESDAETQKSLDSYMYNYNAPQYLAVFDQVLKSQDAVAATVASQMISRAIDTLKKANPNQPTQQAGSTTGRRFSGSGTSGQVQQLSLNSYQRLIPTLKIVMSSNLNNLSQWAQTLLSQLQVASTTA